MSRLLLSDWVLEKIVLLFWWLSHKYPSSAGTPLYDSSAESLRFCWQSDAVWIDLSLFEGVQASDDTMQRLCKVHVKDPVGPALNAEGYNADIKTRLHLTMIGQVYFGLHSELSND